MKAPRIITAAEAAKLIPSNVTVATGGFLGVGYAEDVTYHLEKRFLETGKPEGLTLVHAAGQKAIGHFAHKGLIQRVIAGFYGWSKEMQRLVFENEIEAYNLPQGVIINCYREMAAGRGYHDSVIGQDTFVDEDVDGSGLNERSIGGFSMGSPSGRIAYSIPKIDVALIRATSADSRGNLTFEDEPLTLETLSLAMAAHNSGGIVIAQVKHVQGGRAHPFQVGVPGKLVDYIVKADADRHWMTAAAPYNADLLGGQVVARPGKALTSEAKKQIARRAAMELRAGDVVNIGIGLPEAVAQVVRQEQADDLITLTAESGFFGGLPSSGLDFGCGVNADMVMDAGYMFDFINGGGLDIAFLGFAQVDKSGNVNVSKFGDRLPGCGGFIDISQSAKRIVFVGTERARDGTEKFVDEVEHLTFSAAHALRNYRDVLYVTDEAVYRLTPDGLKREDYGDVSEPLRKRMGA